MKTVKIICIVILVVVLGFVSYLGYEYITNKRDIIGINKILEKRLEDRGTAPHENLELDHEREKRENTPNLNNN